MHRWLNRSVLTASILLLGWVAWTTLVSAREPQYEGRCLSDWIRLVNQAPKGSLASSEAADAVRRIGTNGLPFLLSWLQRRSASWPGGVQFVSQEVLGPVADKPAVQHVLAGIPSNDAQSALTGFRLLGAAAARAVPDLQRLVRQTNDPQLQVTAMVALAQLGPTATGPLVEVVEDNPDHKLRMVAAYQLGVMGSRATSAVPTLILTLATEDPDVAGTAARALARIAPEDPTVVPALVRALDRPSTAAAASWAWRNRCRRSPGHPRARAVALLSRPVCPVPGRRRPGSDPSWHLSPDSGRAVVLRRPDLRRSMHDPGRRLYIQNQQDSVLVLSRQQDPLELGDVVDVSGFPGNDGRKFLLREAVYRKQSLGPQPAPVHIAAAKSADEDLAGLLVQAEGTVLSVAMSPKGVRLLLDSRTAVFEATVEAAEQDAAWEKLKPGTQLSVRGVYEVHEEQYGRPRGFVIRLRSWQDVAVLRQAPWWTLGRLWMVLEALGVVLLASLLYGILISGKNQQLRWAQRELKLANEELEERVAERTAELRQEVASKEQAHSELARAQERLIAASRQAGMAEVATAILHNVGNVLNSVNVSATLVGERLRRLPTAGLGRVVSLLEQRSADLATFLEQDPKGKLVPKFLATLGESLERDRSEVAAEVDSLRKNVEHIKTIVAMQQGYARIGGVVELVEPRDLMESAIRISAAAYERHQIRVVRDYQPAPVFEVDRQF